MSNTATQTETETEQHMLTDPLEAQPWALAIISSLSPPRPKGSKGTSHIAAGNTQFRYFDDKTWRQPREGPLNPQNLREVAEEVVVVETPREAEGHGDGDDSSDSEYIRVHEEARSKYENQNHSPIENNSVNSFTPS